MEGFFDGADVAFATPTPSATAHGVPVEALTPPSESVPREEGTHTERVSETTPISAKTPTPQEGVILATIQTEPASPILPLIISTSDPFAALSQAVKDGSSLVVTPSFIPSSTTRGPNTDLSSEESGDILEDLEDEPVLKKRISNSDEEESASPKTGFMSMCPLFFFWYIYVSALLLTATSLLFVCLFLCLQRPLRG